MLGPFHTTSSPDITKDDVFFYVYGLLHSSGLLLLDCIMPNLTDPESFIRKAIGWCLPQCAHSATTAVDRVRHGVEELPRLWPLSRGEAFKPLG
ncbi:MAG: DNA alkylation repair protein [Actinomycetales bacterium]|nr:DNA alkylation repair protein [Actinomycetales bacterium]